MAISPIFTQSPLAALGVESTAAGTQNFQSAVPLNLYDFISHKYPENLGDSRNGHYINFYINVHTKSSYYRGGASGASGTYQYPGINGTEIYRGVEIPTNSESSLGGFIHDKTHQRISQAISLYIPDSMSLSQAIEWGESSALKFGKSLAQGAADLFSGGSKNVADGIQKSGRMNTLKTVAGNLSEAAKDAAAAGGFAMNPQLLVLFRGIGFRSFQYDFVFTPKNESESAAVRNIIRAFRFHAHPELGIQYGLYYVAPSTFDIEFVHKGALNKNIHKVKSCVLTNYSVDYAPFGWSTYVDGMPIQTKLSLQFKEIEIITKEEIAKGF